MMKKWILPIMLGFGVTLALIIGERMSTDAMAVVIGVAVGVAASVPTSLLLVALLRRERSAYRAEPTPQPPAHPQFQQPNIIVLNPSDLLAQRNPQPMMPLLPPEYAFDGGLRRLRVVGDEEEWG